MTTAVAPPPSSSALAPPSLEQSARSTSYQAIAPSAASPSATPNARNNRSSNGHSPASNHDSPLHRTPSDGKSSPISSRAGPPPKVIVKKEPASPEMASSRHRPRRLDLSKGGSNGAPTPTNGQGQVSAGPRTSKESAGLAIQDMGLACLSPGFHTQDPGMREQLQRSLSVREQQRQIIEARQKGTVNGGSKTTPPDQNGEGPSNLFRPTKTPGTSRRKGPPPGLSINAPSHEQFANERVIQSAPLHQTFTGLSNRSIHPITRHVANQPSSLSNTSHIHHVPATQTNNRLPPISDVFPGDSFQGGPLSARATAFPHNGSPGHSSHSNVQPPIPSPGLPPPQQQGQSHPQTSQAPYSHPPPSSAGHQRPREYKSAEEALNGLAGGREELLPRIVHYGGHQPPTPPSPMPHQKRDDRLPAAPGSAGADRGIPRRRDRDEFERDMSPPQLGRRRTGEVLMNERREDREARWLDGRWPHDSPETQQRKKDEFLSLCSRAWDLFHS